jgi:GMP synthase (glutamine-hydrolysing)
VQAMQADIPVLGHCLGGQLMARALGAAVADSPAPEIGWHGVELLPDAQASRWFGDSGEITVFQWHYDAFELPDGARLLGRSGACPHQAFSIGPHLAMQFHVELDEAKLIAWTQAHDERYLATAAVPTVQGGAQMLGAMASRLAAQQRLADRIYARWIQLANRSEFAAE